MPIHIYDIPIYRNKVEKFLENRNRRKETALLKDSYELRQKVPNITKKELDIEMMEQQIFYVKKIWQYNEIVAWLNIYFDGKIMKGVEYNKKKRKHFAKASSTMFEINLTNKIKKISNEELSSMIIKEIERKFYRENKSRHLDISCFEIFLKYFNFREFLEK